MIKLTNDLEKFANLLLEYNKTHNITGSKNLDDIKKNIIDSYKPLEFLDDFITCVDIGTGAGFPGFVLAVQKPQCRFYLVEPLKKRYAFLNLAKVMLGLKNITIVQKRVEDFNCQDIDLITSRAVTKTDTLLKISSHLISNDTQILLYKGENLDNELKDHLQNYDIIPREDKGYYLYIKSWKC